MSFRNNETEKKQLDEKLKTFQEVTLPCKSLWISGCNRIVATAAHHLRDSQPWRWRKEERMKNERLTDKKLRTLVLFHKMYVESNRHLEELFNSLSLQQDVMGMCLQETWRFGHEILDFKNLKLIQTDSKKLTIHVTEDHKVLQLFWTRKVSLRAAGYEKHIGYGARIIAIRLCVKDKHKQNVGISVYKRFIRNIF